MKIVSKHHDFYDSAIPHFAGEQYPFYLRETRSYYRKKYLNVVDEIAVDIYKRVSCRFPVIRVVTDEGRPIDLEMGVIGFCGKLYPFFDTKYEATTCSKPEICIHSVDAIVKNYGSYQLQYGISSLTGKVNQILTNKTLLGAFQEFKVPVFFYSNDIFVLNPCLKTYGFQKILDPFTTMQELNMYISNDLCDVSNPPMPVGDDIVIARSKGFDKHSFRNMYNPKKRKQKK